MVKIVFGTKMYRNENTPTTNNPQEESKEMVNRSMTEEQTLQEQDMAQRAQQSCEESQESVTPTLQQTLQASRSDLRAELDVLIAKHNLEFTYVRNTDMETGELEHQGGATLAWVQPPRLGDTLVPVSAAWCRTDESFDKLLGRLFAAREFDNGKATRIKLPLKTGMSNQLKSLFGYCLASGVYK